MIKALLFVFEPGVTWDKIVRAKRSAGFILWLYLLPLISLSIIGEGTGIIFWGKSTDAIDGVARLAPGPVALYELAQFAASFLIVFLSARVVRSFGAAFQSRHSPGQCFTLAAYVFSPLFLVRLLDAFPSMNPWATFTIGMALSLSALYQGVPRVLQPNLPTAVGLFVACATSLTIIAILARFMTLLLLEHLEGP